MYDHQKEKTYSHQFSQADIQKYWLKVLVCEHGRHCKQCCWPWIGNYTTDDHVPILTLSDPRRGMRATRFSYMLLHDQDIPSSVPLYNSCRNFCCCNGYHVSRILLPEDTHLRPHRASTVFSRAETEGLYADCRNVLQLMRKIVHRLDHWERKILQRLD